MAAALVVVTGLMSYDVVWAAGVLKVAGCDGYGTMVARGRGGLSGRG